MTPLKRFYKLLELDKKDISQIIFYAAFSGLVGLSLPLGIQAITNLIQSGRVSASWIVLIALVVTGVALVGLLSLMQLRITENLQQKIFVRSSFDFAARLPKIKTAVLQNYYLPELANRFFDTMSIQKGTSKLIIDFSAAILQIFFGLILLSLYHPFFIIFGVLLFFLLYFIFVFSYAAGLETSLKESKFKYKVAGWLQEIARNSYSFKNDLNYNYSLQKNDALVAGYLSYREKHFNVIKRQFIQLIIFKMIVTGGLLSMGGYLLLSQQINIGQFLAAEIIILLVINSVEKIIIGLETLYDVLTSIEKIGQVTDLELEKEDGKHSDARLTNISIEIENLTFKFPDSNKDILTDIFLKIEQGEKIVIEGENGSGKTTLMRILSSLLQPISGYFYINDDTFREINLKQYRLQIGSIVDGEKPFEGTILENITFNDDSISSEDLKWAMDGVQLSSFIKLLPKGIDTHVFPEGKQLSSSNAQKLLLARSIIRKPRILFYEDPTDVMDEKVANEIIDFITADNHTWTIIVSSKNPYWKTKSTRLIIMKNGSIQTDMKNN
jgi:ABC-type bacteriocin/lantibiotic exporter with double-glycine peptidase domain